MLSAVDSTIERSIYSVGTDRKGRREEKQRKGKCTLDVKFEGMSGGSICERTGGRIAEESF